MHNINTARAAFLTSKVKEYGALRKYAEALSEQFGDGWWMIPMKGPVSENEARTREGIRLEKKLVQEGAEEKGLVNVYKPWSDVLKYVKGEKKGANANAPRDIHERLKVELTKLYKAVRNDDDAENSKALVEANWHIGAALTAIGIDLTELNVAN